MNQPTDSQAFRDAACALIEQARELAACGWTPATSSNFSVRVGLDHAAITVSGRDKGRLREADIMLVDLNGNAVGSTLRPSAETQLHAQLYRRDVQTGCVLHTHSLVQTVASRLFAPAGSLRLAGFELLKAFRGNSTHEAEIVVPVLPNSQDMRELTQRLEVHLQDQPLLFGYLIDGHGLYAWGRDMAEARRHLDAFEFLLACELELRKLRIT